MSTAKHRQFKILCGLFHKITIPSERKENVMMMAKNVEILRKDNDCFQCERKLDFKGKF